MLFICLAIAFINLGLIGGIYFYMRKIDYESNNSMEMIDFLKQEIFDLKVFIASSKKSKSKSQQKTSSQN